MSEVIGALILVAVAFSDAIPPFWRVLAGALVAIWIIPWDYVLTSVREDLKRRRRKRINRRIGVDGVDDMSGVEFERWVAALMEEDGYSVENTPPTSDFGADVLVREGGELAVVQCKRLSGKAGAGAVQEVIAARAYYGADRAMVVANRSFTPAAEKLAEKADVRLVGRDDLADIVSEVRSSV